MTNAPKCSLDTAKCPTFSTLTCNCDLDLWATDLGSVCDTSPSLEEHLCHIILKIIHEGRSFSPDTAKCSTFLPLTYDCDLHLWNVDLAPVSQTVSNSDSSSTQLSKKRKVKKEVKRDPLKHCRLNALITMINIDTYFLK